MATIEETERMEREEEEQRKRDADDMVIVEVLKPFTAQNACYNPASGNRPADRAAFARRHAEYQVSKGLSRIIGPMPKRKEEGEAEGKSKKVA